MEAACFEVAKLLLVEMMILSAHEIFKKLKGSAVLNEKLPSKDLCLHFSCADLLEASAAGSL